MVSRKAVDAAADARVDDNLDQRHGRTREIRRKRERVRRREQHIH